MADFFEATIRGVDGIFLRVDMTKKVEAKAKRRSTGRTQPRGYVLAFNKLRSTPSYSPQFPVSDLLTEYFNDIFETSLQNAVDDELETYMQRRLQGKD